MGGAMNYRGRYHDLQACWECGRVTMTGLCEAEHPAYDHRLAKQRKYVQPTSAPGPGWHVRRREEAERALDEQSWRWQQMEAEARAEDIRQLRERLRAVREALMSRHGVSRERVG